MTAKKRKQFTPPTLNDGNRWRGMRVGLFGGSFNPAHAGHIHVARTAMIKFGLDFVWWLVTPQNPLKDSKHTRPYEERYANVESMLAPYPKQLATHLEADMGVQYSFQTISSLTSIFPQTDFIWICGMDNAHIFHKWDHWQEILDTMPVCFIARPPAKSLVKSCPLRMSRLVPHHYDARGRKTNLKESGIYWLSGNKMLDISSTNIRNNLAKTNT